jgi:ligand-binding SRPBCC domain-containing protein
MPTLTIDRHPDRGHLLHAKCVVPRPLSEVFEFFSSAHNLQELTPPWVRFQVLSIPDESMREGTLIDYRLRIHGLPMRWQSEITAWEPERRFVDQQRRGPYRWWRHEHLFEPCTEGTVVIDQVHYGTPGGALVHWLLVGRDLRKIFLYRQQALQNRFGSEPAPAEVALS